MRMSSLACSLGNGISVERKRRRGGRREGGRDGGKGKRRKREKERGKQEEEGKKEGKRERDIKNSVSFEGKCASANFSPIFLSNLPGLSSAGSRTSGRLVAIIILT